MNKQNDDVREDDVIKLAYEYAKYYRCPATNENEYCKHDIVSAFNRGYNKAKENTYTEEQVREAIEMAYMFGQAGHFVGEGEACTNEIIQSLKQPK